MRALAIVALIAAGAATRAAAQVLDSRSTAYLLPSDVTDARAIAVNPAGLGTLPEASIFADVTAGRPGAWGQPRQFSVGIDSRGFAASWQHDRLGSVSGNTFRVGLGTAAGALAVGGGVAIYRGGEGGTSWNLGLRWAAARRLAAGLAVMDIGQPTVRGFKLLTTYTGSATFAPARALLLSGGVAATRHAVTGYTAKLEAAMRIGLPLGLFALCDTDRGFRRTQFAFGITIGGNDRLGAVATTPGNARAIDESTLFGVSTRAVGGTSR